MTQLTAKDMRINITNMVSVMDIDFPRFITEAGLPNYNGRSKAVDVALIHGRLLSVHDDRKKLLDEIVRMGGTADMTMTRKELDKMYRTLYAENNQPKEETKMTTQQDNMVTREYMDQQVGIMVALYEDRISKLMDAMDAKIAASKEPAAPAPVVTPVPEVSPSSVAVPNAKHIATEPTEAEKLAVVQRKDDLLKAQENEILAKLAVATSPDTRSKLRKQLSALTEERKFSMEYIRRASANGLRTYADAQETGVNALIEWTREGLTTIVNLAADGAKAVNTGVANGVRFTADVVDPDVSVMSNTAKA